MSKKKLGNKKPERKLRIIWNANAVWTKSGYGNQSRDLLYRFLDEGWAVAQNAYFGLEGGIVELNGLRIYPKLAMPWGEDGCMASGQDWKADITVCFQDSWVMDEGALGKINRYTPYVPIDHDPVPPGVLSKMRFAYRIITYSKFGQQALWDKGFNSTYIPHGVDTTVFRPLDTAAMRQKFGVAPDKYIIGMIADNKDNPPRKQFQRIMDAFAEFKKKHNEAAMYFHAIENQAGGFPILQYANNLGIQNDIFLTPPYQLAIKTPPSMVAEVMNMFDALVCTSAGEGFGMPITEIQACGRPAIVTDWTAMPELIVDGLTGYKVPVGYKRFSPLLSFVADPEPKDIYEAMEKTYLMDKEKTRKACTANILANYDILKLVKNSWNPFFEQVQADIYKE
jgi:glycosyltransferase involved in cell wall biosynthesis